MTINFILCFRLLTTVGKDLETETVEKITGTSSDQARKMVSCLIY
jgi:hypothetical protein